MQLLVTDNAFKRAGELIELEQKPNAVLRVSVDGGGCSGFMYKYEIVTETADDDYIVEKNGIKIVVDPLSQQYMVGCTVDFVEELGSSYFEIKNPNATAKCGCGNSFSI